MSLRAHYVPSYPPLSVNGPPPPHHQTHRVQAVPVSIATALQQQAAAAQQQSQGTAPSNQSSGGNVQAPQSHEYHITSCLPFQTPAGVAQNLFRHISSKTTKTKLNFSLLIIFRFPFDFVNFSCFLIIFIALFLHEHEHCLLISSIDQNLTLFSLF